jgi:hypothetical protein
VLPYIEELRFDGDALSGGKGILPGRKQVYRIEEGGEAVRAT